MKHGKVWLVGAGPGDPELLTLKAARVLGKADIVIHDDLVHPGTLRYARPGARIVAVGKRGGCRSTRQAFIERLLVAEALAGNMVVRLKGGDPFVFGRSGSGMGSRARASSSSARSLAVHDWQRNETRCNSRQRLRGQLSAIPDSIH